MTRLLAFVVATAVVVTVGCGERKVSYFGDLRVVRTITPTWNRTPPPHLNGPQRIAQDVLMLDRRHGFLTTAAQPGVGVQLHGLGRIQETRDGGLTWLTVWSLGESELAEVAFADARHGFVAGRREVAGTRRPILVRTRNGGRTWQVLRPRLPADSANQWPYMRLQFTTPHIGYAVGDPDYGFYPFERWILRTTDGGRTWHRLPRPKGEYATAMDWLDASHGFAVGRRALYSTADGGRTWRTARRIGAVPFTAVDFMDTRTGLLIGGNPSYIEIPPGLVVLRTDDGGATWRTLYVDQRRTWRRASPFVTVRLVDRRHAWAATGGCKNGQNSPCGGDVWTTADGGRSWRDTKQPAVQLDGVDAKSAIATGGWCECGVLWRTRDAGRSWGPLFGSEGVSPSRLIFERPHVLLETAAGWYRSDDDGATWKPARDLLVASIVKPGALGREWYHGLQVKSTATAKWHPLHAPVEVARAWDIGDPGHVYVAGEPNYGEGTFATSDGGAHWRRLDPPFWPDMISATGSTVLVEQAGQSNAIAISENSGRTWREMSLPSKGMCTATTGRHRTVWLGCTADFESATASSTFRSDDNGRTWTRLRFGDMSIQSLAQDGTELWAIAGRRKGNVETLWHSRNDGHTWVQVWPRLAG